MSYICFWCERTFDRPVHYSIDSPFEGEPDMALCDECGKNQEPSLSQLYSKAQAEPVLHQIKRARGLITEMTTERPAYVAMTSEHTYNVKEAGGFSDCR